MKEPQDFHKRNRFLLLLSTIGGVYLPSLERVIPFKPVLYFIKFYAWTLVGSIFFSGLMALRHTIFLANNLIVRIMAANNVFNDMLCCSRAFLFNVNNKKAQELYDMWDEFFTHDGNGERRQKLLKEIKQPFKKYMLGSAFFIEFMLVSWSSEQLTHTENQFSVPIGLPFNDNRAEYMFFALFIFFTFTFFGPTMISVDTLIMEPLTCIGAELRRLQEELATILGTIALSDEGRLLLVRGRISRPFANKGELDYHMKRVEKDLHIWVQQHQKLYIFHKAMMEVNHNPLAIQLFCTTMTVCLISFILATNLLNLFDTFIALLFFVPSYVLFYISSCYGNIMFEEADQMFTPAFATAWTVYPRRLKQTLHIIVLRTNMPLNFKIMNMFPLGSKTYFQIINTAYSFYSFLRFLTSKDGGEHNKYSAM